MTEVKLRQDSNVAQAAGCTSFDRMTRAGTFTLLERTLAALARKDGTLVPGLAESDRLEAERKLRKLRRDGWL